MGEPQDRLCAAIEANDLEAALAALDAGAQPDRAMEIALANVFEHGVEAMVLLVERGASSPAREHDRATTPLMHLAGAGELAAVQKLLDRGADAGAPDQYGHTALEWAVTAGHWRVAMRIAEAGATLRGEDQEEQQSGGPYRAPASGREELARRCIVPAASEARLDEVRAILDGAPALAHDPALMAQAWTLAGDLAHPPSGDQLGVLELLERRAATPPWEGVERRRLIDLEIVLVPDPGSTWEGAEPRSLGNGPIAASLELVRHVVRRLVPLGPGESSALVTRAARSGRADVLAHLLAELTLAPEQLGAGLLAAADPGSGTGIPGTPGATTAARLLLEAGAPVDARNSIGETPLMLAADRHDLPMLELLLARGADVAARDDAGRTAMAWANRQSGWPASEKREAIALLQRHGAEDQRWKDGPSPPVPPGTPLTTREKIRLWLSAFVVLGFVVGFVVALASRCAG